MRCKQNLQLVKSKCFMGNLKECLVRVMKRPEDNSLRSVGETTKFERYCKCNNICMINLQEHFHIESRERVRKQRNYSGPVRLWLILWSKLLTW